MNTMSKAMTDLFTLRDETRDYMKVAVASGDQNLIDEFTTTINRIDRIIKNQAWLEDMIAKNQ